MTESRSKDRAKVALLKQFSGATDQQGYVELPQQNLVQGVRLDQFEDDLQRGDGNELKRKFCAVHSSAALAVNSFAPFKDRLEDIFLLDRQGAASIQFEKQMPIIPGRRPSNLDVWIDRGSDAVAIESKFLEYFDSKKPEFADAYKSMESVSEPCWWSVCLDSWNGAAQQLDVAQLVKHYFGLRQFQKTSKGLPRLTLLYLFWEPQNWQDIAECRLHRNQLTDLEKQVAPSSVSFHWTTYSELWREWEEIPQLSEHALNLRARYELCV